MLHPSSNQAQQTGLKIPSSSFPFPVPNVAVVWKILKMYEKLELSGFCF
jgi:hypothetical protein